MAISPESIANAASRVKKNLSIPRENYVVFHHVVDSNGFAKVIIIPVDPDGIQDNMSASFAQNSPLSRSAPIYSYQSSGPRSVSVSFRLHRDLCNEYNPGGEDSVDELITNLEAMVLPTYEEAQRIVNPPVVSMRIRDEVYIKGVVTGVQKTYSPPVINYGGKEKYALVDIGFSINEITPYNASILPKIGAYRP